MRRLLRFPLPLLLAAAALGAGSPVRRVAEIPPVAIAAGRGTAQVLFGAHDGAADGALTLLVLQPGAEVPEHVHEGATEILYVLEGEAEMTLDGTRLTVHAGEAVRIPKGSRHTARVVSKMPLRGLQFYAPAGPEQRFLAPPPSPR
jgi:quercetin dioxygenase-like cupin family protein